MLSTTDDHDSRRRGRKGPVVACSLCRRCKAKCVKTHSSDLQCERCKAAGCVCVFEQHKRGRKRVRGLDLPRADAMLPPQNSGIRQDSRGSDHSVFPLSSLRPDVSIDIARYGSQAVDEQEGSSCDDIPLDQAQYTANPLPFISGANRPFSLRTLLNPTSNRGQGNKQTRILQEDLITRGVLSLDMATHLFEFFFEMLNPIIMLLDPALHKLDYIRERSDFLFTAILLAAARFIAPPMINAITEAVRNYSVRAVLGGHRSIETVQGWMVMYFWKAPNDDRGWTYVGLLCRLAVEIGLDKTPLSDMPGAGIQAIREQRSRMRTWMLAFMMDRALSSTTGRDWCLRGNDLIIRSPRSFSEHPLRLDGDAVIAGFTELRSIACSAIDRFGVNEGPRDRSKSQSIARELLSVNYDLDEWKTFWEEEMTRHNSPDRYWAYLRFFELHIRLTLNSFAIDATSILTPAPTEARLGQQRYSSEQYCYTLATENLMQLQRIRDLDVTILQHAQDSIAVMVAYAACFLRFLVNSPCIEQAQRDSAATLIDTTSRMFKTVSQDRQTTAALQADFLGSLFADGDRHSSAPLRVHSSQGQSEGGLQDLITQSEQDCSFNICPPAPNLDFTDFESWLSAFESSTIPEPLDVNDSTYRDQDPTHNNGDLSAPNMANTDWDAIFLSWLNPEAPP